jgi:hypothetical protein
LKALPKASHPAIAGWGCFICPLLRASSHRYQIKQPRTIVRGFVTPSGFLSCIDIQLIEYFVDRFVDLKAKSWVNFTRVYSGKSGFTKVRENNRFKSMVSFLHF